MKHAIAGVALAGMIMLAGALAKAQPAGDNADVRAAVVCLAGRNPNSFAALLRTPHLSSAERTEVRRLMPLLLGCREGTDRFSATVIQLRAAVVDYLYSREFASGAVHERSAPPIPVAPLLLVDRARDPGEAERLASTYSLFECLVATNSEQVASYLGTTPGSDAEQEGFRALFPGMAACLPPSGNRQLAVGGERLRAILAEMRYRWLVVQRDGPASPFAAAAAPAG